MGPLQQENPLGEIPFNSGQGREQSSLYFFAALLKNRCRKKLVTGNLCSAKTCRGCLDVYGLTHTQHYIKQKKNNQVEPQHPYIQKKSVFVMVSFTLALV